MMYRDDMLQIREHDQGYSANRSDRLTSSNERFSVAFGGGCRYDETEKVVIITCYDCCVIFIGGTESFNKVRECQTPEEAKRFLIEKIFTYCLDNADGFDKFINTIKEEGSREGVRENQNQLKKLLGVY